MLKSFYQANREKLQKFNGLLMTNPIMERGFILAPIIVASYNTQNSVALGIGFSIITFITVMLSSFIPRRIPYTVRTILYSLLACVVFVPTAMLIERLLPGALYSLGVFLPLHGFRRYGQPVFYGVGCADAVFRFHYHWASCRCIQADPDVLRRACIRQEKKEGRA